MSLTNRRVQVAPKYLTALMELYMLASITSGALAGEAYATTPSLRPTCTSPVSGIKPMSNPRIITSRI